MEDQGHINVIYGPMFSGKSSELLKMIRRYQIARKDCLVINYMHDNRYSAEEVMSTHDLQTHKALKVSKLTPIKEEAMKYDVIGIDEGQFFEDVVDFADEMANQGKIVVIAALDSTFQRKPFGNILTLVALAEKVVKLTAVCVYCTKSAAFTQRTIESEEIELIGGAQSYKPVCRNCFYNQPSRTSSKKNSQTQSVKSNQQIETPNPESGCQKRLIEVKE